MSGNEKTTGNVCPSTKSEEMVAGQSANLEKKMVTGQSTNSERLNTGTSNETIQQPHSDKHIIEDRMSNRRSTSRGGPMLTPRSIPNIKTDDDRITCPNYRKHYSPKGLYREKRANVGMLTKRTEAKAQTKVSKEWNEEPIDISLYLEGKGYSPTKKHHRENDDVEKMISMPVIRFHHILDQWEASKQDNEYLRQELEDTECGLDQMREDRITEENNFHCTISRLNEQHDKEKDEILWRVKLLAAENSQLNSNVAELKQKHVNHEHEAAMSEIEMLSLRLKSTEDTMNDNRIKMEEQNDDNEKKDFQLKALQAELHELEGELLQQKTDHHMQIQELNDAKSHMIEKYKDEIYQLQHDNSKLKKDMNILRQQLNKQNEELENDQQHQHHRSHGTEKKNAQYETQLQKLSEDCQMKNNEVIDLRGRLTSIEQTHKHCSLRVNEQEQAMEHVKSKHKNDITRKQKVIDELEQRMHDFLKQNENLKEYLLKEKQTFEKEITRMSSSLQTLPVLEQELDATKKRLRKYSESIVNRDNEIAILRSKLEDTEDVFQQTNGTANRKIDSLKKENLDLTSKYHMELSSLEQTRKDLEKQVEDLSSENDELKSEVYKRRDKEKELTDTHAKYSADEESFRNKTASLQLELESAKKELRQTKHEAKERIQILKSKRIDSDAEFSEKLSRLRHDKNDLERRIEQFAYDNDQLKKDMTEQRIIIDEKSTDSAQTIHNYKYELNDANRRLRECSEEEEKRNKEIVALRSRLVDVEQTSQQADRNVNERIKSLEKERSDLSTKYNKEVLRLQQNESSLQSLVESLSSENDNLQKQLNKRKDLEEELKYTKTKFSANKHSSKNKIVDLQHDLETAQNELRQVKHEAKERIEHLKSENIHNNEELTQKLSRLKHDKADLERRMEKLTKDNDQLKKDQTEQRLTFDKESTESSSLLEQTTKSLQKYKVDLKESQRRLRECYEEEDMRKKEIAALRSRLANVEKTSQQPGRDVNNRIKTLEMERLDLSTKYNKEISRLQQNGNDLQRPIESLTSENEKLQKELKKRKDSERNLLDTKSKLQKFSDEEVNKNNEIAKLRTRLADIDNDLQQKNQEVNKYKQELSGVHQTKQDTDKRVDVLSKERDRLQQTLNERDSKEKELRGTLIKQQLQMKSSTASYEADITRLKQHWHDLETYVTNLTQENNRMKEDIQRLTKKQERDQNGRIALPSRLYRMEAELKETEFELRNTETRLHEMKNENQNVELDNKTLKLKINEIHCRKQKNVLKLVKKFEDVGLRASSEDCLQTKETNMNNGNRLSKNTQQIDMSPPTEVELSDIYRPTILAGRFKELFEQQWVEAFEIIQENTGQDEPQIMKILLTILTRIKQFCDNVSKQQLEDIQKVITQSDKVRQWGVPDHVVNYIKYCMKASLDETITEMFEKYRTGLKNGTAEYIEYEIMVEDYSKGCLDICWLIAIQDQPIMFAPEPKSGSTFSPDVYNTHTESGTTIDYLVWPALLLDEDGHVLSKGVVESNEGDQVHGRKRKQ